MHDQKEILMSYPYHIQGVKRIPYKYWNFISYPTQEDVYVNFFYFQSEQPRQKFEEKRKYQTWKFYISSGTENTDGERVLIPSW